jgi:hypothetical protein
MKYYGPAAMERLADLAQPLERPIDLLREEDVVVELMGKIQKRGDLSELADECGLAQGTISNILTGGRPIGANVAERLGYRRVVRFERIR